jgi:hypothetical protein
LLLDNPLTTWTAGPGEVPSGFASVRVQVAPEQE